MRGAVGRGSATSASYQKGSDPEGLTLDLRGDERAREVFGIERPQVLQRLPHADQLDREAELVGDRDGDSAFRAPVELRERDGGHADRVAEQPRLLHTVLSRRRVDDEQ